MGTACIHYCRQGGWSVLPLLMAWCTIAAAASCDKDAGSGGSSSAAASKAPVTSAVLTEELDRVVDEFLAQAATRPRDPRQKPPDRDKMLKILRAEAPEMLVVTGADEQRFKRAEFNDAENRARLQRANNVVRLDRGPQLIRYLVEHDQAQPMTGARLELLAHLGDKHAKLMELVNTNSRAKK